MKRARARQKVFYSPVLLRLAHALLVCALLQPLHISFPQPLLHTVKHFMQQYPRHRVQILQHLLPLQIVILHSLQVTINLLPSCTHASHSLLPHIAQST